MRSWTTSRFPALFQDCRLFGRAGNARLSLVPQDQGAGGRGRRGRTRGGGIVGPVAAAARRCARRRDASQPRQHLLFERGAAVAQPRARVEQLASPRTGGRHTPRRCAGRSLFPAGRDGRGGRRCGWSPRAALTSGAAAPAARAARHAPASRAAALRAGDAVVPGPVGRGGVPAPASFAGGRGRPVLGTRASKNSAGTRAGGAPVAFGRGSSLCSHRDRGTLRRHRCRSTVHAAGRALHTRNWSPRSLHRRDGLPPALPRL